MPKQCRSCTSWSETGRLDFGADGNPSCANAARTDLGSASCRGGGAPPNQKKRKQCGWPYRKFFFSQKSLEAGNHLRASKLRSFSAFGFGKATPKRLPRHRANCG